MRAVLFDYGAGNLHSLAKAVASAGVAVTIEPDPLALLDADLMVLPGVGAFAPAAARLAAARGPLVDAIAAGRPCIGICLGMQLLFERSAEGPGTGLGVFGGEVRRLEARRVPQIGWNEIEGARDPLFERAGLTSVYYANGFVCRPDDPGAVIGWSTHEQERFPAAVRRGPTLGVQFHPEKSSAAGVRFLAAFIDEVRS
jgi:glutamine amidotransferase